MNCDYMKYNVGDLVILKDRCWGGQQEYKGIVGTIIELKWHCSNVEDYNFIVRFESDFLPPMFKDRFIWHQDVYKHYPVLKV